MRISTGPVAPTHHSIVPVQNTAKTTAPHLSDVAGFIFMAQLRRQIPGVTMNNALASHREQHHAVSTAVPRACDGHQGVDALVAPFLGDGRWRQMIGRSDHISPGQTKMMNIDLVSWCQSPAGMRGLTRSSKHTVSSWVAIIAPTKTIQG